MVIFTLTLTFTLTFTFRAFSRRFYPKRLTMNNHNNHIVVVTVRMFI